MTDPTILLIDGDQFIFKACAAVEREIRWDEDNHVLYSNFKEAWANFESMLDRIFARFSSKEHTLCFTTAPNFRRDIDPTYKAHRSTRKPLCYARMRTEAELTYKCNYVTGLEADDVMGILATKPGDARKIIISQDKDMKGIPGEVWDGRDLIKVSEAEADYWHLYQTLVGDTSDGYKGCPGIGPKKAEALLAKTVIASDPGEEPAWPKVVAAFEKANLTEADALTQARLARILRWTDWDSKAKKPILWQPH